MHRSTLVLALLVAAAAGRPANLPDQACQCNGEAQVVPLGMG